MNQPRPATQWLLKATTVGRMALIPVIAASFMTSPVLTTVSLLIFMVADLYDGILARQMGIDGPGRRALDSSIDRIAIDTCLVAAAVVGAMPVVLVAAFLARDLYCAVICSFMMSERGVAIKADLLYRGLNCAVALWAFSAPFISAGGRLASALALLAASLYVAVDLSRSVRIVRRAPGYIDGRVISATRLRRGNTDWDLAGARGLHEAKVECPTLASLA